MRDSSRGILLVEDDPDHAELTLYALREHGVAEDVMVARDGVEALDYLLGPTGGEEENARLPRVVLLDLKLPKLDGLKVLKRIRAHERTCLLPVVVLTSSDEQEDQITSYQNGANSYVRKPVDFTQLSDAVRQLGQYWLQLNEPPPQLPSGGRPA